VKRAGGRTSSSERGKVSSLEHHEVPTKTKEREKEKMERGKEKRRRVRGKKKERRKGLQRRRSESSPGTRSAHLPRRSSSVLCVVCIRIGCRIHGRGGIGNRKKEGGTLKGIDI